MCVCVCVCVCETGADLWGCSTRDWTSASEIMFDSFFSISDCKTGREEEPACPGTQSGPACPEPPSRPACPEPSFQPAWPEPSSKPVRGRHLNQPVRSHHSNQHVRSRHSNQPVRGIRLNQPARGRRPPQLVKSRLLQISRHRQMLCSTTRTPTQTPFTFRDPVTQATAFEGHRQYIVVHETNVPVKRAPRLVYRKSMYAFKTVLLVL